MADSGRRLFLTGAVAASALALMGHSPYRKWAQYRTRHTVIVADGADYESFPLAERLVAQLAGRRPDLTPIAARAESAATVLSLLKTRQLDLALVRAEDAYDGLHGTGPRPDLATPLRALLAVAPEYLYLLAPTTSGVREMAGLKGTRAGIIDNGGRAQAKARRLVAASGLDADSDIRWTSLTAAEAVARLTRGELDACFIESPSRVPYLALDSSSALRLRLVPHAHAVAVLVARHGHIYFPAMPMSAADCEGEGGGPVLGEARLLVCRADYAADRARAIVQALEGWSDLAPSDTLLPIPRHAALADHDTPT